MFAVGMWALLATAPVQRVLIGGGVNAIRMPGIEYAGNTGLSCEWVTGMA